MAIKTFKYFDAGVSFKDQAGDNGTTNGDVWRNGTKLKSFIEGAVREIITSSQSQVLTNKTIDASLNTITNLPVTAISGILDTDLNIVSLLDDTIPSAKATKAYVDAQLLTKDAAGEIAFTPAGTIAATNVQAAVEEVSGDVTTHTGLATGAHAASAISNVPAGSIAATTVQAALNELDSEKAPIASPTFTGTVGGITAAMVGAPSGSGTSTGTNTGDQTNISGNAATVTTNANLSGHVTSVGNTTSLGSFSSANLAGALTDETGSGSAVFGTSPTITSASIVTPTRSDFKQDTKANLVTYALTATNGQAVFATDTKEYFSIKDGLLSSLGGGGGVGSVDFLSVDQADLSALTDYTQTGLEILESPSPILHGTKSFRLQHSTSIKSFKKVIAVDRKFRGKNLTVVLDVVSSATSGNLNILFYNETSASNLVASQSIATGSAALAATTANASNQLTGMTVSAFNTLQVGQIITGSAIPVGTTITALNTATLAATMSANATGVSTGIRISALDAKKTFSFDVPASCASLSWTISSVVEAYAESYIDDVVVQLTSTAVTSTSISQQTADVEVISYSGIGSNLLDGSLEYRFPTSGTVVSTNLGILNVVDDSGNTRTKFVAQKSCVVNVTFSSGILAAGNLVSIYKNGAAAFYGNIISTGGYSSIVSASISLVAGDYLSFGTTGSSVVTTDPVRLSITATAYNTVSTTIPLTTAQLVQQSDSYFKMDGYLGQGSTNTGVVRLDSTKIRSNIGQDIKYVSDSVNGDSWIALTSGMYTVNYSDTGNLSDNAEKAITLNSPTLLSSWGVLTLEPYILDHAYNAATTSTRHEYKMSWTGYLNANDIVRIQTQVTAYNVTATFSMSKQGSLKQLNPSTDSKITIPTHQLRFEGASTRGSTDTAIVKFDSQTITQGDAWDVVNTAANGTVVTMKKAGKLSVSVNIAQATTGAALQITKNQSVLTGISAISSEIMSNLNVGIAAYLTGSSTFDVVVGDKIRIADEGALTATVRNNFTLSLTETSIPANFSNVLPQWSQSDSAIEIQSANGFGSTNTLNRRFSNTISNMGSDASYTDSATLGAYVTILNSGSFNITYADSATGNANYWIKINGIIRSAATSGGANLRAVSVFSGVLNTNDIVTFVTDSATTGSVPADTRFQISKVGKPNLTSVDVTPFVNMKTTDVEAIEALTSTSTFGSTNTGVPVLNITKNTNKGIISVVSDSVSGTKFFALKDCEIKINASGNNTTSAASIMISKNSTILTATVPDGILGISSIAPGSWGSISVPVTLVAGDIIRVQRNSTNVTSVEKVTLTATADNNATASPTQQVSSDTMNFVFQSTALTGNEAVGTFNTYTYGASSLVQTICTTAPTQTTSSMNTNGILLTGRGAYTSATTSATPSIFKIFISKGLKSKQVDAYLSAGKISPALYDYVSFNANASQAGTNVLYEESTGILTLDNGKVIGSGTTTQPLWDGNATYTSGYFVINASKSASLVTIPNLTQRIAYLSDVKASGTGGGTNTAATYNTRVLNTIIDSTGIVTSLVANQFTLPTGTYSFEVSVPACGVNRHRSRLRNITDGTTSLLGDSQYASSAAVVVNTSRIQGEISISSSKIFELQHYTTSSYATQGFGVEAASGENEVYAQVKITKIK